MPQAPSAFSAGASSGPGKALGFAASRRLAGAKLKEFAVISNFSEGYRNREDITTLAPSVMVVGSKNVLTNVYHRISNRGGYTLDGQTDTTPVMSQTAILSSYDWPTHVSSERHLRAGFLNNGSNGKLQYRYVASAGDIWNGHTFTANQVYWIDLMTSLTSVSINFTDYWDTTEVKAFLKWVDGSSNIYEWTGGVTTLLSTTSSTLTKTGTNSWAEENFYSSIITETASTIAFVHGNPARITDSGAGFITAGFTNGMKIKVTGSVSNNGTYTIASVAAGTLTLIPTDVLIDESAGSAFTITQLRQVTINNNVYSYTGGAGTTTLTGVSPTPVAEPLNSVVQQTVIVTPSTAITNLPALNYSLITNFKQHLVVADLQNRNIYGSKTDNAYDFSFTLPTRIVAEGFSFTLDSFPTALITQDEDLYVTGGKDDWYLSLFTLSADLTKESVQFNHLKTTGLQAAQSQALVTKIKNNIAYLSFEPIINSLGPVTNILDNPQASDLSYSIVNDINSYNATDGSMLYHKMFLYVAFPKEGLIRIYNMTDQASSKPAIYWEAPQTIPASRFSIIDGDIYFHSYLLGETYKLFDGFNDNGHPIPAVAKFAYHNNGLRTDTKSFKEFFVEGYIKPNTTLTLGVLYDYYPNGSPSTKNILGTDQRIVLLSGNSSSLGKDPLGKDPFGGSLTVTDPNVPTNKFRVIERFARKSYYEEQTSFSSTGKDFQWEILAFSSNASPTSEGNNNITI